MSWGTAGIITDPADGVQKKTRNAICMLDQVLSRAESQDICFSLNVSLDWFSLNI